MRSLATPWAAIGNTCARVPYRCSAICNTTFSMSRDAWHATMSGILV
jgi:hypothetical protein